MAQDKAATGAESVAPPRDWGHMGVVALIAGVTGWYLYDAYQASPTVDNLILILPASALALGLCVTIAVAILRRRTAGTDAPLGNTPVLMGLFALYIVTLPVLGFDVGSAIFVAAALLAEGERRPLQLLLVPILFAAIATVAFGALIPYPLPTLIL